MTTKTKTTKKFTIEVIGEQVKVNKYGDKLFTLIDTLGWDYTCNRMSRSGMEIYDDLMQYLGALDKGEHWNEDVYADANGDW